MRLRVLRWITALRLEYSETNIGRLLPTAALTGIAAAAVLLLYVCLPDGDDLFPPETSTDTHSEGESQQLAILDAMPRVAASGSAVALSYAGGVPNNGDVQVALGKRKLHVLSQTANTVIVEVPAALPPGRAKVRVIRGRERSRPYELRVKATDWRKPFRNLLGGWVLLVLGVRRLARSVRAVSSLSSWRWPSQTPWQIAALAAGTLLGTLLQSTTTAAGLLAGGVTARRLDLRPAAAAFLGAQLGTAAAPILLARLTEPHSGLLAVAIGGLGLCCTRLSRARAWAWLVLACGFIAFAVQVLRPSLEPFLADPRLVVALARVGPHTLGAELSIVLLGAFLVAIFQGPAPVLALAVAVSQLTGNDHPRDILLLLSGSGLGSALTGLLTMPGGPRCRALAKVNLVLGVCNTVLTAATVELWDDVARQWVGAMASIQWEAHLLPKRGIHGALAFAISQLSVTILLVIFIPRVVRWVERLPVGSSQPAGTRSAVVAVHHLYAAIGAQAQALPCLLRLAIDGNRQAGSVAQAWLHDADSHLRTVQELPALQEETGELPQLRLGCLQLQRALQTVLWHTERLTDDRLVGSVSHSNIPALPDYASRVLQDLYALIGDGLASLRRQLHGQVPGDRDEASAREIQINVHQAELRQVLATTALDTSSLGVMAVVDALEATGNQLFRIAEASSPADSSMSMDRLYLSSHTT